MFRDSQFLASAWRQLLETMQPDSILFRVDDRNITVRDVLLMSEGRKDLVVSKAVSEFFHQAMLEAMKIVRGRFALGLDSSVDLK